MTQQATLARDLRTIDRRINALERWTVKTPALAATVGTEGENVAFWPTTWGSRYQVSPTTRDVPPASVTAYVPPSGRLLVWMLLPVANAWFTTGGAQPTPYPTCDATVALSGANTLAPTSPWISFTQYVGPTTDRYRFPEIWRTLTGLNPGPTTVTARYRCSKPNYYAYGPNYYDPSPPYTRLAAIPMP